MSHFCAAAALLGANLCANQTPISAVEQSFIGHLADYGLSYGTKEEYEFRFGLFQKKDAFITETNANPEFTFTVGHNEFSTLTEDEANKFNGDRTEHNDQEPTILPEDNLELTKDWRSKMQSVQKQRCGDCWAFATTATIEGHHAIKSGKGEALRATTC